MEWKGEALWNRTQMALSARVVSVPQTWAALRRRLEEGHPLIFVAFGSSIVEGGGCFVSGQQAVQDAGVHTLLRPSMSGEDFDARRTDPAAPIGRCEGNGFLSLFMSAVNATWPHPGHLLVNLGRGGVDSAFWANMCTHSLMPMHVDMILIESHDVTSRELREFLPLIVGHVANESPDVAVVVLSSPPIAPPRMQDTGVYPFSQDACVDGAGGYGIRCTWKGEARNRPGKFDYECSPQAIRGISEWVRNQTGFDALISERAPSLGWTVVSLRQAVAAVYDPDDRLGWSFCEWMNAFYSDEIHPGTWLGKRAGADALLANTLFSDEVADGAAVIRQNASAEKPKSCIDAEHLPMRPIRGWSFVDDDRGATHEIRKPGWVALAAEDEAGLMFRTAVSGRPMSNVTLEYLVSYEHMGKFAITCVKGCTCERQEVDCHSLQRVSVLAMHKFEASAVDECRMLIKVLEQTSSGEHKVKILGLDVE